jgi:hypothetical protein
MITKALGRHGGKRNGAGRPLGSKNKVSGQYREDLAELARGYTEFAIRTVVEICADPRQPAAVRATCAFGLLDRGWGKPTELSDRRANVNVDANFNRMSTAQLLAIVGGAEVPSPAIEAPLIEAVAEAKADKVSANGS